MKRLSLIPGLFLATILHAQKDIPAYGKIDKADLLMKECSFDEKAEALVLIDEGELSYVPTSGIVLERRVRIKVLREGGLETANIHISYHSEANDESISGLDAQTYNLDPSGNIVTTKVEKKLIYEKKINKKFTEKVFTFPEVKVGSIIEYRYKKNNAGLVNWYFQSNFPVRYSQFTVDLPTEAEVHVSPYCSRNYQHKENYKGTRLVKTYSMADVPGFRDEPFILNEDFYRDHLETKLVAVDINGRRISRILNWVQVINKLMEDEDFGVQLKRNIPRTAELDEKLKNVSDPYQRMKTVYKYVQDNMEWNQFTGIWAFDGVRSAWKDKKGTVGEINLILVNLLKDAGLTVHPVLVSTHDYGIVNALDAGTYESPGYFQFNKVMAYVSIGNDTYVLDASQRETPIGLIPADILLTEGLVIEKVDTYEWGWRTLWKDNLKSSNLIYMIGSIDENGGMTGEATITSSDYARLARLPIAKKGATKFIERYFTSANNGVIVDSVNFENLEGDSLPLVQKVKFHQTLNSSGDYRYFSSNILTGLEKNPFIADNRFSDVFFGYKQSYTIIGTFMLPDGYEAEGLPKNMRMIMSDTSVSISRVSQATGNTVMVRIQLDFKKPIYPATQYEELHEFYKQLFELLNEQYVIRKKK